MIVAAGVSILFLLLPAAGADADRTDRGRVIAAALDVFDQPDGSAYATTQLVEGDLVTVRAEESGGWLAIEPPAAEFLWVEESDLDLFSKDVAEVRTNQAPARAGRDGARMPGPPSVLLDAGSTVRLLDRPPLVLRQGRSRAPGGRSRRRRVCCVM